MDRALIDTDIFSEILKGIDRNVVTRATTYRALFRRYTISSITVVEVVKGGQPIGRADPLIAAIAIQHNLVLVTGNQEHYGRVRELGYSLKLENWR